jgi:GNAT superfamily N-acetyltransferase
MDTEASPMRRDELFHAITTTSRAFWPDPLFGHFARNAVQEHQMLPIFLGAMIDDARRHGEIWVVRHDDRVIGSASWLPPGALPRGALRESRIYRACVRALRTGTNRRSGIRLLSEVERMHPTEPHWYLAVLGVDPKWQSRGIGGALLKPVLDRCDSEGVPAHLETQKIENLPFYERFGFVVTEKVMVEGTPPVWLMWREPRPA